VADRSVSIPMTLSDLERRDARGHFFQADLLYNARTVWPRTTTFISITHEGRGVFLGAQCIAHGGGAQAQRRILISVLFMRTPFDAELPNFTWKRTGGGLFLDGQPRPTERGRAQVQPIFGFYSIYAYTFWRRTTKFDVVTHIGSGLIRRWSATPPPKGRGRDHSGLQFLRFLSIYAYTLWRRTTKFHASLSVIVLSCNVLSCSFSAPHVTHDDSLPKRNERLQNREWTIGLRLLAMHFHVFGGRGRETAKDSPNNIVCKKDRSELGNLIKVIWKLYEVV